MLDYTIYAVSAEYCVKNNLVIDSYRITDSYKAEEYKGEFFTFM